MWSILKGLVTHSDSFPQGAAFIPEVALNAHTSLVQIAMYVVAPHLVTVLTGNATASHSSDNQFPKLTEKKITKTHINLQW